MGENIDLTGGQIYIDGEQFDGIKEIDPVDPADLPEYLPRIADTAELTLSFTPEQAAAIVETFKPVIDELSRMFQALAEWAAEVFRKVGAAATETANTVMDRMLYEANDNPRWWYLYKHAKRRRTRKKYRRLLMKQLHRKLEAAQKYKEVNV